MQHQLVDLQTVAEQGLVGQRRPEASAADQRNLQWQAFEHTRVTVARRESARCGPRSVYTASRADTSQKCGSELAAQPPVRRYVRSGAGGAATPALHRPA